VASPHCFLSRIPIHYFSLFQVETVRYATLALANISSDLESHRYILDEINLLQKRFYSLTDSSDEETVQYFALWLRYCVRGR
jgi:hypothetical protein